MATSINKLTYFNSMTAQIITIVLLVTQGVSRTFLFYYQYYKITENKMELHIQLC